MQVALIIGVLGPIAATLSSLVPHALALSNALHSRNTCSLSPCQPTSSGAAAQLRPPPWSARS